MDMIRQSHDVAVYGGYIDNDDKLMQSSSGGIATALAEQIPAGGYIAGVVYSDDFRKAEYVVTNDIHALEKLKGSKYVETDKKDVYKSVKALNMLHIWRRGAAVKSLSFPPATKKTNGLRCTCMPNSKTGRCLKSRSMQLNLVLHFPY